MRIKVKTNIGAVCNSANVRYALNNVEVTPDGDEHVFLAATNGHSAVVSRAAGSVDAPCMLPGSLSPPTGTKQGVVLESADGHRWNRKGRDESVETAAGGFPNIADVLKAVGDPAENCRAITFNTQALAGLLAAIGTEEVTLFIPTEPANCSDSKFVAVTGDQFQSSIGVIGAQCRNLEAERQRAMQFGVRADAYATAKAEAARPPLPF